MTEQQIIEAMAKHVFAGMRFDRDDTRKWVEGGNSFAQECARVNAKAAYAVAKAAIRDAVLEEAAREIDNQSLEYFDQAQIAFQDLAKAIRAMKRTKAMSNTKMIEMLKDASSGIDRMNARIAELEVTEIALQDTISECEVEIAMLKGKVIAMKDQLADL